jgi:hypothetical protein
MIHENNTKKWMQDWVDIISQVKSENSFNKNSDEWIEIEGIGRFKGLKIITEEHQNISEITVKLKYDIWNKNIT